MKYERVIGKSRLHTCGVVAKKEHFSAFTSFNFNIYIYNLKGIAAEGCFKFNIRWVLDNAKMSQQLMARTAGTQTYCEATIAYNLWTGLPITST
jgi:hypothetical protein